MDDVTSGFGSYDLTEICKEFMDNAGENEKNEVLPWHVGGSRVDLLLGIKNTNLDPVRSRDSPLIKLCTGARLKNLRMVLKRGVSP